MRLPQHRNPSRSRTATAPYNFIPLPDTVAKAEPLPHDEQYPAERFTGYFEVFLTTKTPLYIRGPLTADQFEWQENDLYADGQPIEGTPQFRRLVKNLPGFFHSSDPNQPRLPGSSLRGMLRAIVEIAAYGKISWVPRRKLFFRTVDDSSIGLEYNRRMVERLGIKPGTTEPVYRSCVRAGFIRRQGDIYQIEECGLARIDNGDVPPLFGKTDLWQLYDLGGRPLTAFSQNPNQTPNWSYQGHSVYVKADRAEHDVHFEGKYLRLRRVHAANTSPNQATGATEKGTLVLTGRMQNKHMAFVFIPKTQPNYLKLPNNPQEEDDNKRLVDRFHSDDQLTQWQERAFKKGKPAGSNRERDGFLADGEPVFFLTNNGGKGDQVIFIGRASLFRLPYNNRPFDRTPPALRDPTTVDMAEAIFGFVRSAEELQQMKPRPKQGDPRRACAGRVFVSDAVLDSADQGNLFEAAQTPRILATPKPTAFQHYLTQYSDHKKDLHHYDTSTNPEARQFKPVIRGHKLYWHRDEPQRTDNGVPDRDTQHTQIRPVKAERRFCFRVYFDCLTMAEVGAMAWALRPNGPAQEYCHRLGMGKSLGYGSVALEVDQLCLVNESDRYQTLFADAEAGPVFATGLSQDSTATYCQAFEKHVLQAIGSQETSLAALPRIAMLLKMLEYPGPDWRLTRTMPLDSNDGPHFRARPILPDPLHLGGENRQADPSYTQHYRESHPEDNGEAPLPEPALIEDERGPGTTPTPAGPPSDLARQAAARLNPRPLEPGAAVLCVIADVRGKGVAVDILNPIEDERAAEAYAWIERAAFLADYKERDLIDCVIVAVGPDEDGDLRVLCRPLPPPDPV